MLRKILSISALISATAILPASIHAATDTATATAVILSPIAIAVNTNMSFGDVYADNATPGTVVLSAVDGSRTVTGPVGLGATAGAAAVFDVTGSGTLTYAITLPAVDSTLTSGANTMTVTTFTDDKSGASALVAGSDQFNVGATLNVGAAQATGTYVGSFDVTVQYN